MKVWTDGTRYEGSWRSGKRHGHGILHMASGDVYEGGWWVDCRHGWGLLRLADGSVEAGEWELGTLVKLDPDSESDPDHHDPGDDAQANDYPRFKF